MGLSSHQKAKQRAMMYEQAALLLRSLADGQWQSYQDAAEAVGETHHSIRLAVEWLKTHALISVEMAPNREGRYRLVQITHLGQAVREQMEQVWVARGYRAHRPLLSYVPTAQRAG